jgi:hypothetical protein
VRHHHQLHHAARRADEEFAHRLVVEHLDVDFPTSVAITGNGSDVLRIENRRAAPALIAV